MSKRPLMREWQSRRIRALLTVRLVIIRMDDLVVCDGPKGSQFENVDVLNLKLNEMPPIIGSREI
jgi:hypothetical protein